MDAVTPKANADLRSQLVRPADMEWQQTRFPGCEAKTLLFDPESGLVTALMRFAPGAVLPDHEHVKIEQTYVLEGRLVDKEGPGRGPHRRPRRVRLAPGRQPPRRWTPEGGLMLAIFQIPNKFYERDGRVTDATGQDWESVWGRSLANEMAPATSERVGGRRLAPPVLWPRRTQIAGLNRRDWPWRSIGPAIDCAGTRAWRNW